VQGLVWGLFTGNVPLAVSIGLIFELLWLDLIPAGTFLPPNMAVANFCTQALATMFGLATAGEVVIPVILSLPFAFLGARLERFRRRMQNADYNRLLIWTKKTYAATYDPGVLIARSMIRAAFMDLAYFVLCYTLLAGTVWALFAKGWFAPVSGLTFAHLWVASSVGGILALRTPKAYAAAIAAASGVLAFAGLT